MSRSQFGIPPSNGGLFSYRDDPCRMSTCLTTRWAGTAGSWRIRRLRSWSGSSSWTRPRWPRRGPDVVCTRSTATGRAGRAAPTGHSHRPAPTRRLARLARPPPDDQRRPRQDPPISAGRTGRRPAHRVRPVPVLPHHRRPRPHRPAQAHRSTRSHPCRSSHRSRRTSHHLPRHRLHHHHRHPRTHATDCINQLHHALAKLITKHGWTTRDDPADLRLKAYREIPAEYDHAPGSFRRAAKGSLDPCSAHARVGETRGHQQKSQAGGRVASQKLGGGQPH